MTAIHQQMALEETTPGMVLSDDVLDPQGHVLLPKGATLTEHTIDALGRHDIHTVRIEAGEMSDEEEAERRARHAARIEQVFRRMDDDAATPILYRYVRKYRLGDAA